VLSQVDEEFCISQRVEKRRGGLIPLVNKRHAPDGM
jgi:hypothetical protein